MESDKDTFSSFPPSPVLFQKRHAYKYEVGNKREETEMYTGELQKSTT